MWGLDDIARHLAGINRYTGGSRQSVAQHCVVAAVMAKRFYPSESLLPARMLIHDAHESIYGDVSAPLKALLPGYRELEQAAMLSIERRFDLTFVGDPLVKEVDYRMWLTERLCDMCGPYDSAHMQEDYSGPLLPFYVDAEDDLFEEWSPARAEEEWLHSFHKLLPWCVS